MTALALRSLRTRKRRPEIMDQPGLDPVRHAQALRGLRRINGLSGTARRFWPELEKLSRLTEGRTLRVLDAACGGGDVAISLAEIAKGRRIPVEVQGCDLSPTALEYAREQAKRRGATVGFFEHDVLATRLPDVDVVLCSLFLHHLSDDQAVSFLRAMSLSAQRLVQVSDLVRSRVGLAFAFFGGRLLTRSDVVHVDALRSVEAAFTVAEATTLAERAGLRGARFRHHFPERFHLIWRST